jgi:hypothetical protein
LCARLHDLLDPVGELLHRLSGRHPLPGQYVQGQLVDGHGLRIEFSGIGLKLNVEGVPWLWQSAGAKGQHRVPAGTGAGGFHIDDDVGLRWAGAMVVSHGDLQFLLLWGAGSALALIAIRSSSVSRAEKAQTMPRVFLNFRCPAPAVCAEQSPVGCEWHD